MGFKLIYCGHGEARRLRRHTPSFVAPLAWLPDCANFDVLVKAALVFGTVLGVVETIP